jgi:hypothetical protein
VFLVVAIPSWSYARQTLRVITVHADIARLPAPCSMQTLMSTLNAVRIRSGEECNDRITWLETSLMRMVRATCLAQQRHHRLARASILPV